jgi:purine-binding chemotaxis protein CheW
MASLAVAATRVQAPPSDQEPKQYLTFMLGREMMAMGIRSIREILEYTEPTLVPMMPADIRGVIDLRGAVVPVVDLAARIGRPSTAASRKTCIVIIEIGDADSPQIIGAVVDAVNAVIEVSEAEIEPPPMFGSSIRRDFIEGLGKVNGRFVVILDTNQLLSTHDQASVAPLRELPAPEASATH